MDSFGYISMMVDVSLYFPFSNFSCLDLDEKSHRASMRMQGTHAPMKSTERITHGMIRFPGNFHKFWLEPWKLANGSWDDVPTRFEDYLLNNERNK